MKYITKDLIKDVLKDTEPFLNEYEFQFAVAMALKEKYPDLKVKIEQNVYCSYKDDKNSACRCDIVCYKGNKPVLLAELKYVVVFDNNQASKTSCAARSSFISDIARLKELKEEYSDSEKYCIFASNKTAVYKNNRKVDNELGIFNKTFAIEKLWTKVENDAYKPSIRFLIVELNEYEIPSQYCY